MDKSPHPSRNAKRKPRSRFFTHSVGFQDDGIALEVRGRLAWLHTRTERVPGFGGSLYELSYCLEAVRDGDWREITRHQLRLMKSGVPITEIPPKPKRKAKK